MTEQISSSTDEEGEIMGIDKKVVEFDSSAKSIENLPCSRDSTKSNISYKIKFSALSLNHQDMAFDDMEQYEDLLSINFPVNDVPFWTSCRFRLAILCFFGFMNLFCQRVNLSIAIVKMSGRIPPSINTSRNMSFQDNDEEECSDLIYANQTYEFTWGKQMEGYILGSFYYGYLILQIPCGRMAERIGAKRVILWGMLPVSILTILTPVIARAGPAYFIVCRIFIGVGQGVLYPASQALWYRWSPPKERSRLIGFSYAGGQVGNAIIFPMGGYLSTYYGWPSVFYVTGVAGFIWCVLWWLLANDSPEKETRITELERRYILLSLGMRVGKKRIPPIPWLAILTSPAVISLAVIHACSDHGFFMLLTQIPTYMKEVLKMDIESNGLYSMFPYLAFIICIGLGATLSEWLMSKEKFSVANLRKLMSGIGTVGPGFILVALGYVTCDKWEIAVVFLTISVGLSGFAISGFFVNHGDIAPPFAGTLYGLTNSLATVMGFIAPVVVSILTPNGSQAEWNLVFLIAGSVYIFGCLVFIIFGKGVEQPWAMIETIVSSHSSRK